MLQALPFARLRAWKSAILGRNTGHNSGPHFAPAGDALTSSAATGTVPGTSMAARMRWRWRWRFAMGCGICFWPQTAEINGPGTWGSRGSSQLRGTIPPVHIDPTSSRGVGWPLIFGAFQGLIWGRDTRLLICLTHLSYP